MTSASRADLMERLILEQQVLAWCAIMSESHSYSIAVVRLVP
jgi:hypothetical protein